ncbi:MAG: NAD(+)/NADH kinase [Malacoplasma sp.]|nr:NAD(+)/NADH kinase [Malacoplasma sp.]
MSSNKYWIVDNGSAKAKSIRKQFEALIPKNWTIEDQNFEYLFVIGGDGTFLRNKALYSNKKIVAINGGNFGYYSYFNVRNIKQIFSKISNDSFFYHPLEIEITIDNQTYFCINEVLIRSDVVFKTDIYLNNQLLEFFKGSGILVATPLGSTAHAKNVGGAIINPNLAAIQFIEIEPITQKSYSSLKSPLILGIDTKIVLKAKDNCRAFILLDGIKINKVFDSELIIKASYAKFKMFKPDCNQHYIKKLRESFIRDK